MDHIEEQLAGYKLAAEQELDALLGWWKTHSVDEVQGGFYGEVGNNNIAIAGQAKGIVLNSRILWTFSAAYLHTKNEADLVIAKRAFDYIAAYFYDSLNGGFYWSVNADGQMLDGKKQIYGQAFTIYGLSEYYKATGNEQALELAKKTFALVEQYSFDPVHLGYIEAFDQAWQPMHDLRLSNKDLNAEKSMNTHLHIIEAYANLYQIWKDEQLANSIRLLLFVFKKHIIINKHLSLFFTVNWQPQTAVISYGHDIEAAWLLQECAESLNDIAEIKQFKAIALEITAVAKEGIDLDGGMFYEHDPVAIHTVKEKHWWPQAEAMVGFFNAYQLTQEQEWLIQSIKSWLFVSANLKDHQNGEWFWGMYPDCSIMKENKAGFWKCPYHNGRACLEIMKRIDTYEVLRLTKS